MSASLSLPYRPLVVVTGGRLTDVADAYLMDPTVTERVVVVSSMGSTTDTGARDGPAERRDGSLGRRHRHGAFSLRAGQRLLRPDHRRPDIATGGASRQRLRRLDRSEAAEHLQSRSGRRSGRASWRWAFRASSPACRKSRRQGSSAPAPRPDPISSPMPAGPLLLVTQSEGAEATARFWKLLTDPNTYRP